MLGGSGSSKVELTNEQFEQITGVSDAETFCSVENERRKNPRVAFGMRAKIKPLFQQGSIGKAVMVRDISRSGIGLLCSDPMNVSDEFVCTLPTQAGPAVHIHCIVVRCDRGGCGGAHHVVGATFELVIENAALFERAGDGEMVLSETIEGATPAEPVEAADPHPGANFLLTPIAWAAAVWSRALGCCGLGSEAWRIRNRLRPNSQKRRWKLWSGKSAAASKRPGKEPLACPPPPPAPIEVRIDPTPIPAPTVPVARLSSLFARPPAPAAPAEVAAPAAVVEAAAAPGPEIAPAAKIEPPLAQPAPATVVAAEASSAAAAAVVTSAVEVPPAPVAEVPPTVVENPGVPVVEVAADAAVDAALRGAPVPLADVQISAPVAGIAPSAVQPAPSVVAFPAALFEPSNAVSGGSDRQLAPSRKSGQVVPVSKTCVSCPRHPRRRMRR
jgi:hypothetical protein